MLAGWVVLLDGAERRRGGEQALDAVLGDHPPEGPGVGRSHGLPLVHHGRGAHEQRRVHDVGVPDHPADVRGGPPDVARADVVDVGHRPGQRHRVAAVVAHDALRTPRRTRGVEDVERVGGIDGHRVDGGAAGHRVGPGHVPAVDEVGLDLRPLQDDRVVDGVLGELERLVEKRLVGDGARGLDTAGGRDDHPRGSVVDAHGELLRREPAEHHRVHGTEPGAGEHRYGGLGHHGHVDDDPVARLDAEGSQGPGEPGHLVGELGVGVGARRPGDR